MSETDYSPNLGEGPGVANTARIPHSLEELYGYFAAKEDDDPQAYAGYAQLAAEIADSIDTARRYGLTDEPVEFDLALIPGRPAGIYDAEQTAVTTELMELIMSANKLEPVVDELGEYGNLGRILWQSTEKGPKYGVNIVEHHWKDVRGPSTKLTAVSHVPEDLLLSPPAETVWDQPERVYSPRDEKAIKVAKTMQSLASQNEKGWRDAQIDFYQYIQELPESTEDVPPEELAA